MWQSGRDEQYGQDCEHGGTYSRMGLDGELLLLLALVLVLVRGWLDLVEETGHGV